MNSNRTLKAKRTYLGQAILMAAASLLITTFLSPTSALFAQTANSAQQGTSSREGLKQSISEQEIQLLRKDLRDQRRQVVAANLPLTTEESAKFWPVYDQYIGETIKVNDVRFQLMKDYAANYSTITNAKAADYIRKWVAADKSMIDLRLKYIPIVEKVLSEKKSATFFQIDRRIQLMIDLQVASLVPLVNPQE